MGQDLLGTGGKPKSKANKFLAIGGLSKIEGEGQVQLINKAMTK